MSDSGYETSSDNEDIEPLIEIEAIQNNNILNENAMQQYPHGYLSCCNQTLDTCGNLLIQLLHAICF